MQAQAGVGRTHNELYCYKLKGANALFAVFQFPSNGKLHSNNRNRNFCAPHWSNVSIPFKRETAFKLGVPLSVSDIFPLGFQFPSNGKLHSNTLLDRLLPVAEVEFQFPSNGKLHSNSLKQG